LYDLIGYPFQFGCWLVTAVRSLEDDRMMFHAYWADRSLSESALDERLASEARQTGDLSASMGGLLGRIHHQPSAAEYRRSERRAALVTAGADIRHHLEIGMDGVPLSHYPDWHDQLWPALDHRTYREFLPQKAYFDCDAVWISTARGENGLVRSPRFLYLSGCGYLPVTVQPEAAGRERPGPRAPDVLSGIAMAGDTARLFAKVGPHVGKGRAAVPANLPVGDHLIVDPLDVASWFGASASGVATSQSELEVQPSSLLANRAGLPPVTKETADAFLVLPRRQGGMGPTFILIVAATLAAFIGLGLELGSSAGSSGGAPPVTSGTDPPR